MYLKVLDSVQLSNMPDKLICFSCNNYPEIFLFILITRWRRFLFFLSFSTKNNCSDIFSSDTFHILHLFSPIFILLPSSNTYIVDAGASISQRRNECSARIGTWQSTAGSSNQSLITFSNLPFLCMFIANGMSSPIGFVSFLIFVLM